MHLIAAVCFGHVTRLVGARQYFTGAHHIAGSNIGHTQAGTDMISTIECLELKTVHHAA